MMNKHKKQWLTIYLIPYALLGILTLGGGLIILPLGGTLGVAFGLFYNTDYFSVSFIAIWVLILIVSLVSFIIGYKFRENLWAKILNASSAYLWCFAGLVTLSPHY